MPRKIDHDSAEWDREMSAARDCKDGHQYPNTTDGRRCLTLDTGTSNVLSPLAISIEYDLAVYPK